MNAITKSLRNPVQAFFCLRLNLVAYVIFLMPYQDRDTSSSKAIQHVGCVNRYLATSPVYSAMSRQYHHAHRCSFLDRA